VFFGITLGKPIFQRKNNNFFKAYFSLIAAIQNTLSTTYLHAHQRGAVVLAGDEPAGPPREARTATSGRAAAQRRPLQHHRGQHRGPHRPNAATLAARRHATKPAATTKPATSTTTAALQRLLPS